MATHLIITGTVQGVGYRAWFQSQANALGLHGWVRNRLDGSVEAALRGEAQAIDEMLTLARSGPAKARVREVSIADMDDAAITRHGVEMLATR